MKTRIEILEQLKAGEITSEEAVVLLEQLDRSQHEQQRSQQHERQRNQQEDYNPSYEWVEDLKENLADAAKNVVDFITNQDFSMGLTPHVKQQIISAPIQQMLSFRATCKNAKVYVTGYAGDTIQLDIGYKAKFSREPEVKIEEENGHYAIVYDDQAVYAMGMQIRIPEQMIQKLLIQNANGEIRIENIQAEQMTLDTKNAGIYIEQATGGQLSADTKNAAIYVKNGTWQNIKCKTANAKILVDQIEAEEVILQTLNAGIVTENAQIRFLSVKTSNAGIRLNHLAQGINQQYPLYTIEAFTTNGGIKVVVPWTTAFPCKINAATTSAGVKAQIDNFVEQTSTPCVLMGETADYEEAASKATLYLKTTNGSIKIMP